MIQTSLAQPISTAIFLAKTCYCFWLQQFQHNYSIYLLGGTKGPSSLCRQGSQGSAPDLPPRWRRGHMAKQLSRPPWMRSLALGGGPFLGFEGSNVTNHKHQTYQNQKAIGLQVPCCCLFYLLETQKGLLCYCRRPLLSVV